MNMNFLQSIVMGIVSGLAEMLPISSEAHRALFRTFFGIESEDALFRLLVHISCLIALCLFYSGEIIALRKANRLMKIPPKRRRGILNTAYAYTVKLLRSAVIVMILCRIPTFMLRFMESSLLLLSFALIVNGLLLLLPRLVRGGNMDSRNMPRINGLLLGLGAGLSVFPGISAVGAVLSVGHWRTIDRKFALKFSYILLIPVLCVQIVFDFASMVTGGTAAFSGIGLVSALAGAAAAGFAAYWGIRLMNNLADRSDYSFFSYYSWGIALLSFMLYLMI